MKGKIAKYVTVGTNDLNRAKEFYDQLFSDLGVTSFGPNERSFFWTIPGDDTNFAVFVPYDGEEASMVMPGDRVKMIVELIQPIAIENGMRFAIREGGRTVGAGVVSTILK